MKRNAILAMVLGLVVPNLVLAEASPISPVTIVNTFTTDAQNNCDISSAHDGKYVYVWDSDGSDGAGFGISAFIAGLPGEYQMNTYADGDQTDPAVSHSPDGSFLVAWVSDSPTAGITGIIAQRFKPNGTKIGGEIVVRVNGELKKFPDISHGANGGFMVTWLEGGPLISEVWARPYNLNGVALTLPFQLTTTSNANVGPSVSHNSLSDVVIAWQHRAVPNEIHAVCFDVAGNLICSEFKVNTSLLAIPAMNVDVSHGDDDGFIVVWDAPYNAFNDADIRGQRFASTGAPIGGEFVANSTAGVPHVSPVIAHGPLGDFVVAWRRAGQLRARCFTSDATPLGSEMTVGSGDFPPPPALSYYKDLEFAFGWTDADDIWARLYKTNATVSVGSATVVAGRTVFARPVVFEDRTDIHFELGKSAAVSVRVLDLQGRTVRTLADRAFEAGSHRVAWQGEDTAGRSVPAGVYFYSVTVLGEVRSGRVIRIR